MIIPVPGRQTGGYRAMINGGVPLRYSGNTYAVIPFVYRYENISFSILVSRFPPGGAITDAWIISCGNMKEFLESAYEEEFARESLGILKHEIESAHLMNPLWPADFGCPDLPARDVLSPRSGPRRRCEPGRRRPAVWTGPPFVRPCSGPDHTWPRPWRVRAARSARGLTAPAPATLTTAAETV